MSSVKSGEALRQVFFLKAVFVFVPFRLYPSFETFSRLLATVQAVAPPAIRARPFAGRHQLTRAVTAKKRARPISKPGRCQPQCASGRAPFQILSVCLHLGDFIVGSSAPGPSQAGGPTMTQPKACGVTLPVRRRRQSTPVGGRWPRWLSYARLWSLWAGPAPATIS